MGRGVARGLGLGVLALTAAVAGGIALATAFTALRGSEAPGAQAPRVEVRGDVSPRSHLFGAPVRVTVEVVADRRVVDLESVRVARSFPPYGVVGAPAVTRSAAGDTGIVRHVFTLFCLRADCRPAESRARFVLRAARVTYRLRDGTRRGTSVALPNVYVATQLDPAARVAPEFVLGDVPLPEASYRIHPDRLGAGLLAAGGVLGLAGLVLLGGEARRAVAEARARRADRRTPLERALAAVRRAQADPEPRGRRLALDGLARAVDGAHVGLADSIRSVAWSAADPAAQELGRLADDVEATLGSGR